jgi:SAM-dependent methyltransferase
LAGRGRQGRFLLDPLHGKLSGTSVPTLIRGRTSREEGTVSQDQQDTSTDDNQPSPPTAAEFDGEFATVGRSPGLRRVWQQASPDLPLEIEPYSFVSAALLGHVADALGLSPRQTLVDLGCGRGGPGLWLAQSQGALLIGVDFSAVAVLRATNRAALFGLADRARFVVGDLAATGLPAGIADAVVSIDALHFATDAAAAAGEARRLLRPGGRLVLTNWQPRSPVDPQLPSRMRID